MSNTVLINRNSFFSFLSSTIRLVTNFFLFIGIARFYGTETFGQFTIAHTYMTLFLLIADFGFDLLLATEVSRNRNNTEGTIQKFFPIKMIFSLGAVTVMCIIAVVSDFSVMAKNLMLILSIGIVSSSVASFFFALFKGHEQLFPETRTSFYQNLFLLLALIVLGLLHTPILWVAIIFVLSRFLAVLLIINSAIKYFNISQVKLSFRNWKKTLLSSFPFGLHLLFGTLYFQLDTLLLAYWKNDQAVGVYQAAFKLIALVLIIPDVLVNALLPVLTRLNSENHVKWKRMSNLFMKTLIYVSLPFSLIMFVYAPQIINLVYGADDFIPAIEILRIFALTLIIRFSSETYALMLTTSNNQKSRMYIVIGITILNLIMNSYAIPRWGTTGAAIVSLISNLFAGIFYFISIKLYNADLSFQLDWKVISLVGVTVITAIILWQTQLISFHVGVIMAAICYPILYYFLGYTYEERQLVITFPLNKKI